MVIIIFNDLPSISETTISRIAGISFSGKTATQIVEDYPSIFSLEKCRYGVKLSMISNWGTPKVALIYLDGETEVTIYAEDKTDGDEHSFIGGRRPHYPHQHITISW